MQLPTSLLIWARAHHNLVTRQRWIDSGLSSRSFDRAIAAGIINRRSPSVALLAGAPDEPSTRIRAWTLSLGPYAVASHRSAAYLWGADVVGDTPVDLLLRNRSARSPSGAVIVHRPRDGRYVHSIVRRGVPVTSPLRTLVDLGAVDADRVPGALETFLVAGLVAPKAVAANAHRERRRGRPGSATLVAAMDSLAIDGKLRDSLLEARGRAVLDRGGLGGFVFHHVVGPFEVDFAFPEERVAVELDGWTMHGRRDAFEDDRARDAVLVGLGWVVLRFTWRQITNRPGWVASRIGEALARRGRVLGRDVA